MKLLVNWLIAVLLLLFCLPVRAEIGGRAGVKNFTGPIGMTGGRTDGSDFINEVCSDGVCPVTAFGAVSTTAAYTGTVSVGALSSLTLNLAFPATPAKVAIVGAGPSSTLLRPSAPVNSSSACSGSCTTSYQVEEADIGAQDDVSQASLPLSFSGNATLSMTNGDYIKFTPSATNAAAVQRAFYLSTNGGSTWALWGCRADTTQAMWIESTVSRAANFWTCPDFVPSQPPAVAVPQILITPVTGTGTVLTLTTPATNAVSGALVYPLSGDAINAALAAAYQNSGLAGTSAVTIPAGNYYTAVAILQPADTVVVGAAPRGAVIKSILNVPASYVMQRSGPGIITPRLDNLTINANGIAGGLQVQSINQPIVTGVIVTGAMVGPAWDLQGTQNGEFNQDTGTNSLNCMRWGYSATTSLDASANKFSRFECSFSPGYQIFAYGQHAGVGGLSNWMDNSILGDFEIAPHYNDATLPAGSPHAQVTLVNFVGSHFYNIGVLGDTTSADSSLDALIDIGCLTCVSGGPDAQNTSNVFEYSIGQALLVSTATNIPMMLNHAFGTITTGMRATGWAAGRHSAFTSDHFLLIDNPLITYYTGAVVDTGSGTNKAIWRSGGTYPMDYSTVTSGSFAGTAFTFTNIGSAISVDGQFGYCSDCGNGGTEGGTCVGSGTGMFVVRSNGVRKCF